MRRRHAARHILSHYFSNRVHVRLKQDSLGLQVSNVALIIKSSEGGVSTAPTNLHKQLTFEDTIA